MTSIITGDLIKSREHLNPEEWINLLKTALSNLTNDKTSWELYRGDSFQIEIKDIQQSFMSAVYLKACIKTIKDLDVRLAIGIGNKSYQGKRVTESNGDAFLFSGETLETLKKDKLNLKIKTSNTQLNAELNLYIKLALTFMDSWTVNSAEIVKLSLEKPEALQQELADIIKTTQNAVSKRQKRAHFDEILELDKMYRQKLNQL